MIIVRCTFWLFRKFFVYHAVQLNDFDWFSRSIIDLLAKFKCIRIGNSSSLEFHIIFSHIYNHYFDKPSPSHDPCRLASSFSSWTMFTIPSAVRMFSDCEWYALAKSINRTSVLWPSCTNSNEHPTSVFVFRKSDCCNAFRICSSFTTKSYWKWNENIYSLA